MSERQHGNENDRIAFAVIRSGDPSVTVGRLPRELSNLLWHFLAHDEEMECEVMGNRRQSPLVQGGLEIPCHLTLSG